MKKKPAPPEQITVAAAAKRLHAAISAGELHDMLRQHHADMSDHDFGQYIARLLRVLAEIE